MTNYELGGVRLSHNLFEDDFVITATNVLGLFVYMIGG